MLLRQNYKYQLVIRQFKIPIIDGFYVRFLHLVVLKQSGAVLHFLMAVLAFFEALMSMVMGNIFNNNKM